MGKINRRRFLKGMGTVLGLAGYAQAVRAVQMPPASSTVSAVDEEVQKPPLPFVPGSWTLVVLPDTQHYPKTYPGLFHLQSQWVVDNKSKYNILYVLTLGDIVDNNNELQWQRADRALGRLDGIVPYTVVLGNHDYGLDGRADTRDTLADDYFPPARFASWPTFGGVMERGRIENNYHLFKAGSRDWLILDLEWGPRDRTLDWANQILSKFANRRAIIATHAYLYSDSTRYDWYEKGQEQRWNPHVYDTAGGVNDGEEMWNKLVKKHKSVLMVISGHVLHDGLGFLVSTSDQGNAVNQMLVNFQMKPLGGESWLRLLEFLPDRQTIQVKTYCPLYEKFKTDPDNQFVIKMPL